MTTYSARAECSHDVELFEDQLIDQHHAPVERTQLSYGEVAIQFESELGIEELRDMIRRHEDSYVLLQTLRACSLSENTLERNFEIH